MTDQYQLTVAGRLPDAVTETIVARYGDGIRIRSMGGRTTLHLPDLDQPSLRAMLVLLWDFGHEVLSLSSGAPR